MLSDFVMSNLAWLTYNRIRFAMGMTRGYVSLPDFLFSENVVLGQVVFPLMMMAVYYLTGYYNEPFRKSRLSELSLTFISAINNSLIAFFVALINDMVANSRTYNYEALLILLGLLFFMVYVPRAIITSHTSRMIKSRRWGFKTLVVGDGAAAFAFVNKMEHMRWALGYDVAGYVHIDGENAVKNIGKPVWDIEQIEQVCAREQIKEIIVVPTLQDSPMVLNVINKLFPLNLPIKLSPDKFNVLSSRARLSDLYGDPLIDVSGSNMTEGQKNIKRLLDVMVSAVMLVLLIPVYALVAVLIKLDSPGPVLYRQERVGWHNKPFHIIKFRTMVQNAEQQGRPQLSSEDDPRITRLGRVLRKYRIYELPQFWNVLRGDMSLVGPRPERQYFVTKIMEREPVYSLVHQVRPGITSLGMVKFGYARNVDEMLERLHYDLLYLENMSIINDLKILAYTIRIVFMGRGL